MAYQSLEAALTGSMRDFRELKGPDLVARVEDFYRWQENRRQLGLWSYSKSTEEAPLGVCAAKDETGPGYRGVNFASQDYLGLSSDPEIKETAKAVIDEYGVHSAGSSALAGNTKYSLKLEETISEFLAARHTILYPTGWAAGYGVIKGLVRPDDHVVMDGLSHACLQEGAMSATPNVHLHGHLNLESARRHLRRIRSRDTECAILVVTESLFSMDSDTPDLAALQELCREFNATLLVDVAHDLGCIGADGRGCFGSHTSETSSKYDENPGLGLALSHRYCRLMGGDLSVESEPSRGSCFTIRVPARLTRSATIAALPETPRNGVRDIGHTENSILVIDDDPSALDLIERILSKEGITSVLSRSVVDGIARAREHLPAAIILDIRMQQPDGWQALRLIRQDRQLCPIKVILLTVDDDFVKGRAFGADAHLLKPIDRDALIRCIRAFCPALHMDELDEANLPLAAQA